MTAKTRKPIKYKKLIVTVSAVLAAILVFVSAFFVFLKVGEARLRDKLSFTDSDLSSEEAYGDSADVYHNGQGYVYNDNLINILCLGVDKAEVSDKRDRQADVIYLLSLDTQNKKLNAIAISRNTLTDIDIYDMNDEFLATDRAQICLSYVYGRDDEHSAYLTSKAVSRLMYDLPINAYYTVFMDSVKDIVDAVGGVEMTLSEDMTSISPRFKKGEQVTISGDEALRFIRYREESNQPRMERQKLFISSFITAAKKKFSKDLTLPLNLYNKLSKNSVTDIKASSVTYLATEMARADFNLYTVKGTWGFDEFYETFEVDEDSLYQMVLDIFYIKTK